MCSTFRLMNPMLLTSDSQKIGHFRFQVGTGNRKADVAEAETELYLSFMQMGSLA